MMLKAILVDRLMEFGLIVLQAGSCIGDWFGLEMWCQEMAAIVCFCRGECISVTSHEASETAAPPP